MLKAIFGMRGFLCISGFGIRVLHSGNNHVEFVVQMLYHLRNTNILPRKTSEEKSMLAGELDNGGYYSEIFNGKKTCVALKKHLRENGIERLAGLALRNNFPVVFFAGILREHFGHFLTENLGRLWACREIGVDIPIAFWPYNPEQTVVEPFQKEMLRALGIPNPVFLITKDTRIDKLVVAEDKYNFKNGFAVGAEYINWIKNTFPDPKHRDGPDIYVSRSKFDLNAGRFLGEKKLESILQGQGYQVFHPQEHCIADQISVLQKARRIIIAESSAVHLLALVGHPEQRVALIRRRRKFTSYLKRGTGVLRGVNVRFINGIQAQFVQPRNKNPMFRGVTILDSQKLADKLGRLGMIENADFSDMNADVEAEFLRIQKQRGEFVLL